MATPSTLEIDQAATYRAVKYLFTLIGSGGAFLYLVDLYRKRVRIRVRILDENFYSQGPPGLSFEAENRGLTPTSIEPNVLFSGYLPRGQKGRDGKIKMVHHELVFYIGGPQQRTLSPNTPVRFEAMNDKRAGRDLSAKLGAMFFKTYTFTSTGGRKHKVRIRSADGVFLPRWRYVYERLKFKL